MALLFGWASAVTMPASSATPINKVRFTIAPALTKQRFLAGADIDRQFNRKAYTWTEPCPPARRVAAHDKYWVYRPLLDLIGNTEGTDKGRGHNETLAYGRLTGGPVDLVAMSLTEIDALQTRMLQHKENVWNSSAVGRYQIVGTTLRAIRNTLGLTGSEKYDADMQERLACFLLGQRGIDKYLSGRLSEDTMLLNLAKEWASLPTPQGGGYTAGSDQRPRQRR